MIKKFFYSLNYPQYEKDIFNMEMRYLFGYMPIGKHIFSMEDIKPERSPFIKERISVEYEEDSLEEVISKILSCKTAYEDFKVVYVKDEGYHVEYKERLKIIKDVGAAIMGNAHMHSPKNLLGITKANDKWIFGKYEKNNCNWHSHDSKPNSYSNSLGIRLSRALVNMAIGNNLSLRLIDPCCGVGTVVIDALSMGIDVQGVEINEKIAIKAKENLEFFGYKNVITAGDMREISERFDVAIVDLPYGVFTPTTLKEQNEIIKASRRIADKVILVTFENMDKLIEDAGFKIIDKGCLSKGNFIRLINVCI